MWNTIDYAEMYLGTDECTAPASPQFDGVEWYKDHFFVRVRDTENSPFYVNAFTYSEHWEYVHSGFSEHANDKISDEPDYTYTSPSDTYYTGQTYGYNELYQDPALVGVGVVWSNDATAVGGAQAAYVALEYFKYS